MGKRTAGILVVGLALAGCGGGGSGAGPAPAAVSNGTTAQIGSGVTGTLSLTVANGTGASAKNRSLKFVSPGALSAGVSINNGTVTFADVSASSTLCATAAGVRTCTITVGAPPGNATFAVSLFDAASGGGHLLGSGSNSTMVAAGTPFTVAVGINPIIAAIVSSSPSSFNFTLGTSSSVTVTATFADASGQVITGSGNVPNFLNPLTISFNDPHVTVTPTTLTTPGQTFKVSYDGNPAVASVVTTTVKSNGVTVYTNTIPIPGLFVSRHGIGSIATVFPYQLIVGPDGHLWWAEDNDNMVGSINPAAGNNPVHFATGFAGGHPIGIAAGGDGNIWVNDGGHLIQRFSTAGSMVGGQINVGAGAFLDHMAADQGGNVWYLDIGNSIVGEIDFGTQTVHPFNTVTAAALASLDAITLGPDGAMYFTERAGASAIKHIGRVTTSASAAADGHPLGYMQEYPIPNTSNTIFPTGITKGPDGNLWFLVFDNSGSTATNQFFAKFAPVTPPATINITEYPNIIDPNAFANLVNIAAGPDGNLWIVQGGGAVKIPPANPTGAIAEFYTDNGQIDTYGLVAGPDGNMWFTGLGSAGGNGFIPTTDSVNSFTPR